MDNGNQVKCTSEAMNMPEPHVGINDAIGSLETVIDRLKGLRGRISPIPMEESDVGLSEYKPSLRDVLTSSAYEIRTRREKMLELIYGIESLLFEE